MQMVTCAGEVILALVLNRLVPGAADIYMAISGVEYRTG